MERQRSHEWGKYNSLFIIYGNATHGSTGMPTTRLMRINIPMKMVILLQTEDAKKMTYFAKQCMVFSHLRTNSYDTY